MRIKEHPILGEYDDIRHDMVTISVDGKMLSVPSGETVAAALIANGIRVFRYTEKYSEPRGIFCGIGQCRDCTMTVDSVENVRTCVTKVRDGMKIETGHSGKRDVK